MEVEHNINKSPKQEIINAWLELLIQQDANGNMEVPSPGKNSQTVGQMSKLAT